MVISLVVDNGQKGVCSQLWPYVDMLEDEKAVGKEDGQLAATNFHPYHSFETFPTCRFFSERKHGLVDAAVRSSNLEKTAMIALPGGIGTLDEALIFLG